MNRRDEGFISPPVINLLMFVRKHILKTDRVLDVGSGPGRYKNIFCAQYVSLDAWPKNKADYIVDLSVEDFPFPPNSFDVLMMLDFVEHLEKARAYEILEQAKAITRRSIILLTPKEWYDNQKVAQNPTLWDYGNKYCDHLSFWSEEDFKESDGWTTYHNRALKDYHLVIWNKVGSKCGN